MDSGSRGHGRAGADRAGRRGRACRHRGVRSDLGTVGGRRDERACRQRGHHGGCAFDRCERDAIRAGLRNSLVLAIVLAACLAFDRLRLARWLALAAALGLVAAIAWTGHAGATPGEMGTLASGRRCVASDRRCGLVGGLGAAGASARDHSAISGRRWRAMRHGEFSALGIASVTRADPGNRHRQRLDPGRFRFTR